MKRTVLRPSERRGLDAQQETILMNEKELYLRKNQLICSEIEKKLEYLKQLEEEREVSNKKSVEQKDDGKQE